MQIKTTSEPVWIGPVEVFWMLTNRCNLQCAFCMVESQPQPEVMREELTRDEHLRMAQAMIDAHVMQVFLTGGEPTLIPHLEEIVALLAQGGAYVYLTTNGMLLTQDRVRRLVEAGLNEGQVSLNGATAEVNDALMGRHAQHGILRGLRWMGEEGLRTQVKATITRANQHEMIPLVERLFDFGVDRISLSEVAPLGRAAMSKGGWGELRPDLEVLRDLERQVERYQGRLRVEVSSFSTFLAEEGKPALCSLGDDHKQVVILLPDSNMIPCTSVREAALANKVTEHGWLGAYRRLAGLYGRFQSEALLPEVCRRCEWVESCQGGCRANAFRTYGTWRAPDPLCPLIQSGANETDGGRWVIPLRAG